MRKRISATAVLRAIVAGRTNVDELAEDFGCRKPLLRVLGALMRKDMVVLAERSYRPTAKGVALIQAGQRVPTGPRPRPKPVGRVTFRDRMWRAFRMRQKAALPDLIEIARQKTDAAELRGAAFIYMRALIRAGVATELPIAARNHRNMPLKRFALIRDLGPKAPATTRAGLYDRNREQLIPYREKV